MSFFAAETGQWAIGGGLGLMAMVGLIRYLLGDRTATGVLQQEISDLRKEIRENARKIAELEALYDEQRREKHRLNNELGRAQMLLGVVGELAEQCTCGALAIVGDLLARADAPDQ